MKANEFPGLTDLQKANVCSFVSEALKPRYSREKVWQIIFFLSTGDELTQYYKDHLLINETSVADFMEAVDGISIEVIMLAMEIQRKSGITIRPYDIRNGGTIEAMTRMLKKCMVEIQKNITRKEIGQQLKNERLKTELSIRDVEEKSGVSKNIICRTEGGRANTGIDTIAAIAAVYGKRLTLEDIPE